jgi:hypothetical protein
MSKWQEYIDSVAGDAHQSAVQIIRNLETELADERKGRRLLANATDQINDLEAENERLRRMRAAIKCWCNTDPTTPLGQALCEIEQLVDKDATVEPAKKGPS